MDEIVEEPLGGAQRGKQVIVEAVGARIEEALAALREEEGATLKERRREKFLAMGQKGLS